MKAILVWSDRTNMKYSLFDDKDGISGYEREAMYKEFDIYNQKNIIPNPYVYKGNDYCYFEANGQEPYIWKVFNVPEENTIISFNSCPDAQEFFGHLFAGCP